MVSAYMSEVETSIGWQLLSVNEVIADSRNGRSIRSEGDSGNGRVLTLSAVREVGLNASLAKSVPLDDRTARAFAIEAGDVFVSRSNTMDLVGLASVAVEGGPPNTIYPDLLIRLKPNRDKVLPLFLAYALRFPSVRRQIRSRAKGTSRSMVKISGAELRDVVVPVPSTDDQERFVARLQEIGTATGQLTDSLGLEELRALTEATLRKAFSGGL
jgi:restriction endonuclease S subunit